MHCKMLANIFGLKSTSQATAQTRDNGISPYLSEKASGRASTRDSLVRITETKRAV